MTTTENGLTIVRHATDRMTSVYRGREYLGSAVPVFSSEHVIIRWSVAGPRKECNSVPNEQAAIDYLAA